MKDWRAYALCILSFCPFINNFNISHQPHNHTTDMESHYKYAEKYQLLGGKSALIYDVNCSVVNYYLLMCTMSSELTRQPLYPIT
jgi:hypothetical protein